jgi:HEAT repeat protein
MDTSQGRGAARPATPRLVALSMMLALAAVVAGCKSNLSDPYLADDESQQRAGSAYAGQSPPATRPLDARLLADGGWYHKPPLSYARRGDDERRWHHRRLDAYLHAEAPRSDVAESMASPDPLTATNAAIVAAHWKTNSPGEHLAAAIGSDRLPLPVRCAAAEALGMVDEPTTAPMLRALVDSMTRDEADKSPREMAHSVRQSPDLHADLLRALSRHAKAGDEQWFNAGLNHSGWQVRLEAVAAWSALVDLSLPDQVVAMCDDRDPRVRAVALRTIAVRRDPRAVAALERGLDDEEFDVRVAAISGLSDIGTADAKALLGRLKDHGAEMQQAAALARQAATDLGNQVQTAAQSAQSQMRMAVAQSLDRAEQRGRQLAAESTDQAREYARQASAQAAGAIDEARAVTDAAKGRIAEVQRAMSALRDADLPQAARRQASEGLERLARDADVAVRVRAAQAMGEVADPVFLPALMALLSDVAEVQQAAMASLTLITGGDVTAREGGRAVSDEERIRMWQLWYRERQDAMP